MIAVKLWGGLGNQMFQYAFGKYLEKIRDEEVFYYAIPPNYEINCDIKNFRINLKIVPITHLEKNLIFPFSEFGYRSERKLVQKFPFINPKLFVEKSLRYNPCEKHRSVMFDGYWQSYKYFSDFEDQIVSEFQIKDEFYNCAKMELEELTASDSVSLHIRRSDYLTVKGRKVYACCGKDYYLKAIEKIKRSVQNPVFFIFSDDIEWVKNEKDFFHEIDFKIVDNAKNDKNSLLDFISMSHCNHNIIANSTFSWWAAWLNKNCNKVVIAPANWYKGKLNNAIKDLIPDSWIIV